MSPTRGSYSTHRKRTDNVIPSRLLMKKRWFTTGQRPHESRKGKVCLYTSWTREGKASQHCLFGKFQLLILVMCEKLLGMKMETWVRCPCCLTPSFFQWGSQPHMGIAHGYCVHFWNNKKVIKNQICNEFWQCSPAWQLHFSVLVLKACSVHSALPVPSYNACDHHWPATPQLDAPVPYELQCFSVHKAFCSHENIIVTAFRNFQLYFFSMHHISGLDFIRIFDF